MSRDLLVTLVLFASTSAFGQTKTPSIEGVWQISSVVTTGAGAENIPKAAPRATFARAKDPNKLTDAEKIARFEQWNEFTGQAGTYQINGNTLSRRPTTAKNVTVMTTDPPEVSTFRIEGNKLTLEEKSAAGQPVSQTTIVLTRVE